MARTQGVQVAKRVMQEPETYKVEKPKQPVVIVDDDHDDRLLLIKHIHALVGKNTPIVSLSSGEKFLEYMQELDMQNVEAAAFEIEIPQMIFLDLLMPGLDGLETLKTLRQQSIWMDVPITIVTASRNDVAIENAEKMGANALLPKPYTKQDVMMALCRSNHFSSLL
jgi:CheY-like chemotaxis protein